MLRPPPPLQALHASASASRRLARAQMPRDDPQRATLAPHDCPPPISLYMLHKATYNTQQDDDDEDDNDVADHASSSATGHRTSTTADQATPLRAALTPRTTSRHDTTVGEDDGVVTSAVATASPVRTPLRALLPASGTTPPRQAPAPPPPQNTRTVASPSSSFVVAPVVSMKQGQLNPCHPHAETARNAPTEAMREWAVARTLEADLAPYLPVATQAVLDALVAVEEDDDVPAILSNAIGNQLAVLTRRLSVRAAAAIREAEQRAVRPADVPPVPSPSPQQQEVAASMEELRQLREEVASLRALLTSQARVEPGPAMAGTTPTSPPPVTEQSRVAGATPTEELMPRQSTSSQPRVSIEQARVTAPQRAAPTCPPQLHSSVITRASRPAATVAEPEWVCQGRTPEEEEIWQIAQRILDESRT